ncbi:MAG: peptidoglycan DD-metalloendopeptidase family protein [Bacillota bacterium]|nr:peptidoglycan DD-metalloendopeptidase family protein [Bacillota bacterium]MDP4170184.1 peptidoglycan DD-metalloendopeptidase family protein [Bacillota bacterium]
MRDYIVRFLIAGIMALLVSLLFLGGRHSQASMLNVKAESLHWSWPADGIITDTFGTRHGKHKGIDIAGKANTEIHSVDDGVVEKSYYSNSYGNVVFIKHDNHFVTVYAHLNKRLVEEGQKVGRGETIGLMGSTGQATGVHLHFEIHEMEWTIDKKYALNPEDVMGAASLGEIVQAGEIKNGDSVVAASIQTRENDQENNTVQALNDLHKMSHIVSEGETLWSIAQTTHSTVDQLQKVNHLTGTQIIPGQELLIEQDETDSYLVKTGDNLSNIARENHQEIDNIKELNKLQSDTIYPNQLLLIRKKE